MQVWSIKTGDSRKNTSSFICVRIQCTWFTSIKITSKFDMCVWRVRMCLWTSDLLTIFGSFFESILHKKSWAAITDHLRGIVMISTISSCVKKISDTLHYFEHFWIIRWCNRFSHFLTYLIRNLSMWDTVSSQVMNSMILNFSFDFVWKISISMINGHSFVRLDCEFTWHFVNRDRQHIRISTVWSRTMETLMIPVTSCWDIRSLTRFKFIQYKWITLFIPI